MSEALHIVRLGLLKDHLRSVLCEAASGEHPNDMPDGISATLDSDGSMDIEYTRGGIPVAGEGM